MRIDRFYKADKELNLPDFFLKIEVLFVCTKYKVICDLVQTNRVTILRYKHIAGAPNSKTITFLNVSVQFAVSVRKQVLKCPV